METLQEKLKSTSNEVVDLGIDKLPEEEETLEDIRMTEDFRHWYDINFCKRLRKMR